jgi:hypothetical protein
MRFHTSDDYRPQLLLPLLPPIHKGLKAQPCFGYIIPGLKSGANATAYRPRYLNLCVNIGPPKRYQSFFFGLPAWLTPSI